MPARVVVALALAVTSACAAGQAEPAPATLRVVAAENVWGDVARQIGGAHVSVTSIITDAGADPHVFETDARAAAAFDRAQLVVLNGAGYDEFATSLLARGSAVITVADVVGASGDDVNPHLWYDPTYVRQAADAITVGLGAADPAHAAEFAANEAAFLAGYQPYVDTLTSIRTRYAGAPVGYTERVPGYVVEAAGLVLATPVSFAQAVEDGDDPSIADTAAVDRALRTRALRVLLYNAQVASPTTQRVQDLALTSGVPVVGISETLPAGLTFQAWQTDQVREVLAALGG